jgi:hypothetical protein
MEQAAMQIPTPVTPAHSKLCQKVPARNVPNDPPKK